MVLVKNAAHCSESNPRLVSQLSSTNIANYASMPMAEKELQDGVAAQAEKCHEFEQNGSSDHEAVVQACACLP